MKNCKTPYFASIAMVLLLFFFPAFIFAQCSFEAHNQVAIPLGNNGTTALTTAMVLSTISTNCSNNFTIEIHDSVTNTFGNNIADCSMIGNLVAIRVTNTDSGVVSLGSISVEDNIAPTILCTNFEISCSASVLPDDIGGVVGLDNCDTELDLNYSETIEPNVIDCIDPNYYRVIRRLWTATDDFENISSSCEQTLSVLRADINDIDFPLNYDNIEEAMLDCSVDYPTPAVTGVPMLDGNPIDTDCKITVNFADNVVDLCNGTYKVIRTWTAIDCCTPDTLIDVQIIKVADATPPSFTCPNVLAVGTDSETCQATVILPTLEVSDDCSSYSTTIYSPFGAINFNGATYNNIPVGTYDFDYVFIDDCDNASTCTIAVTVADDDGPTMLCETFIDISIGTSGFVIVQADDFDETSFDDCCNVLTFEIKELGASDIDYVSSMTFNCTDLGVQTITLKATDCNGFSNTCDILVEVEDTTAPFISCPAAVIIECVDYPATEALTGIATGNDNCGALQIISTDAETLSNCNARTVIRTYTAIDNQGLTASCTQTLTYQDTTAPTITYPEDITINVCDVSLEDIDAGIANPVGDCEIFSVTPFGDDTDQILDTESGCGLKILRTHQVTEECSGTIYSQIQTIVIMDNEAPIFDQAVGDLDVFAECDSNYVFPPTTLPTATDFCGNTEVTLFSDDTVVNPSTTVRTLTYRAVDDCGNEADYLAILTLTDDENPTFSFCIDTTYLAIDIADICSATTDIMDIYTATDNCDSDVEITNSYNTSGGDINGTYPVGITEVTLTATDDYGNEAICVVQVEVRDITAPNIDECNSGPIVLTLNSNGMVEITLDDTPAISFSDDCSTLNMPFEIVDEFGNPPILTCMNSITFAPTPVPLTVFVHAADNAGNISTCTFTAFSTPPDTLPDLCDNERGVLVHGIISTETDERVKLVEVSLGDNTEMLMDTTLEDGSFIFFNEYPEEECLLIPQNNAETTNGVTSYDLVLLKRHILHLEYLDSPYKVIAADINNSGIITSADLVAAKRAILGLDTTFQNNTSWRFFPKNQYPVSDDDPMTVDLPEEYLIVEPAWFTVGQDFIGVKIGDLNNSVE